VELPEQLTVDTVEAVRKVLKKAYENWLAALTNQYSSCLPLIQGRLERNKDGDFAQMPVKLRQYLRVPVPAHRKALTRDTGAQARCGGPALQGALSGAHASQLEVLLVLSDCSGEREPRVTRMHGRTQPCRVAQGFLQDVYVLTPDPHVWTSLDELLQALVHCRDFDLTQRLMKYTFEVFAVYLCDLRDLRALP
jgi:hypothetical protein